MFWQQQNLGQRYDASKNAFKPPPPPPRWLMLLSILWRWFCCWLFIILWTSHWWCGFHVGLCFCIRSCYVPFLVCNHIDKEESVLTCFYCLSDVLLLLMFWGSYSQWCWLVCSLWLWYFLIILIYLLTCSTFRSTWINMLSFVILKYSIWFVSFIQENYSFCINSLQSNYPWFSRNLLTG